MKVDKTTHRGPASIVFNGHSITMERDYTTISDIRQTAFGTVDFGYVIAGPSRWVRTKLDG